MREKKKQWVPAGHFYSPIPNINEVENRRNQIFENYSFNGLNIDLETQIKFLEDNLDIYKSIPFTKEYNGKNRYYYNNEMFTYADAISLYLILLKYLPNKIIEVGSGFSSALMLDTADLNENLNPAFTFIEPYPDRLKSLLKSNDQVSLIEKPVQDANLDNFKSLQQNDILFIDSSHVSKTGSDVNHLFFNVLPVLQEGVIVHIHDIGPNFEYPLDWIREGRAWNESYLLRAFLMYNNSFRTILSTALLFRLKYDFFRQKMPLFCKGPGGSFWIRKTS